MDDDFGSVLLDTLSEPLSNLFDKPTSISLDTPAEEEQVSGTEIVSLPLLMIMSHLPVNDIHRQEGFPCCELCSILL